MTQPRQFPEEFRQQVLVVASWDRWIPGLPATLPDRQLGSYQEEIGNLVTMIDDLSELVLRGTEPTEVTLDHLVRARRSVSWLRGLLVPHQLVSRSFCGRSLTCSQHRTRLRPSALSTPA